jgi:hypothetical protein
MAYDPMRLYTRLADAFGWTHESMQKMDWRTLSGYLRELNLLNEERAEAERAASERGKHGRHRHGSGPAVPGMRDLAGNPVGDLTDDIDTLSGLAARPRRWEGADGAPDTVSPIPLHD